LSKILPVLKVVDDARSENTLIMATNASSAAAMKRMRDSIIVDTEHSRGMYNALEIARAYFVNEEPKIRDGRFES
jgi:hypothetical protein